MSTDPENPRSQGNQGNQGNQGDQIPEYTLDLDDPTLDPVFTKPEAQEINQVEKTLLGAMKSRISRFRKWTVRIILGGAAIAGMGALAWLGLNTTGTDIQTVASQAPVTLAGATATATAISIGLAYLTEPQVQILINQVLQTDLSHDPTGAKARIKQYLHAHQSQDPQKALEMLEMGGVLIKMQQDFQKVLAQAPPDQKPQDWAQYLQDVLLGTHDGILDPQHPQHPQHPQQSLAQEETQEETQEEPQDIPLPPSPPSLKKTPKNNSSGRRSKTNSRITKTCPQPKHPNSRMPPTWPTRPSGTGSIPSIRQRWNASPKSSRSIWERGSRPR